MDEYMNEWMNEWESTQFFRFCLAMEYSHCQNARERLLVTISLYNKVNIITLLKYMITLIFWLKHLCYSL